MIKNIENKIKLALVVSLGSLLSSVAIVIITNYYSYLSQAEAREKIYVLDNNGTPVLVNQTSLEVNIEIEAKSHVNQFHLLFFSLPPDDEFIKKNIERAMYLIDESGLKQYNNLKEKGYYNSILASSASLSIKTDSIKVDTDNMSFQYFGTQRIERETSILKRALVTEGKLMKVHRSENNPHGLLIIDWRTVSNKDISYKPKKSF